MALAEKLVGLHENPAQLLRKLISFDTTNPPGNERPCIEWAQRLLAAYGIDSQIFARDANRPNLVAPLKGRGRTAAATVRTRRCRNRR